MYSTNFDNVDNKFNRDDNGNAYSHHRPFWSGENSYTWNEFFYYQQRDIYADVCFFFRLNVNNPTEEAVSSYDNVHE